MPFYLFKIFSRLVAYPYPIRQAVQSIGSTNLAQAKIKLDFKKSLAFRRSQPSSVPSEWDLHLIAMIKRVAKDYKL
jgi:hypothetical protein